jgi:proteasome alpha subunit
VAILDRTRSQPRKFSRLSPARLSALLGERGPSTPAEPAPEDTRPGAVPSDASPDDPTDPTDQESGHVAPLEDPVTGEPNGSAPPSDPQPPIAPPPSGPTGPAL